MLSEGLRRFGPSALIALSLAVALFYLGLLVAPLHFHNADAFYALDRLGLESLVKAWKSRVLSLLLARGLYALVPLLPELPSSLPAPPLETLGIAHWLALWFLVIAGITMAAYRERAPFHLLATYACVAFGYTVGAHLRVYPWDMPALAVFAAFVALVHRRAPPLWIAALAWLGMAFKETAVVLALFPLALPLSWRERARWGAVTGLGCLAVKLGLDLATGNALGFTMATESFYDEGSLWWWNVRELARGLPLAVNGGTLLVFLLLPSASRTAAGFKAIALAFAAGNFAFGVVTESRIWFEMIPLALYALDERLGGAGVSTARAS